MTTWWAALALTAATAAPPTTGHITCATRDYVVVFSAEQAWTIFDITWQGHLISGHNGFHGTVMATGRPLDPVKSKASFVGTGHTEGGREQVESVALAVDGQPVELSSGQTYRGARTELTKHSMIDHLRHTAVITILDDRVTEHHEWVATAEQPCALLYAFMHCWVPSFGQWIAQPADGPLLAGTFSGAKDHKVDRDVRWSALYNETDGYGVVTSYPELYPARQHGAGTFYWDQPHYHKQYLHYLGSGALPEGTRFSLTLGLQGFAAPAASWTATAAELARTMFGSPAGPA